MTSSAPAGRSVLLQPRRYRPFGLPVSMAQFTTLPSEPFTSMWIQACGLDHTMFVTIPRSVMGLLASYSAANE